MEGGSVDELVGVTVEGPMSDQLKVEVCRTMEDQVGPGLTGDDRKECDLHEVDEAGGHQRAYAARPKAHPAGRGGPAHFRLRYDVTDSKGAMTLRRGGRLYHLKIGAAHARRRVLAIVDEQEVTVVALDTGEVLSAHRIEPDKGYWRNTRRDPGRWPGSRQTG